MKIQFKYTYNNKTIFKLVATYAHNIMSLKFMYLTKLNF